MLRLRLTAFAGAVALVSICSAMNVSAAETSNTPTQACTPRPESRATVNVDNRGRATVTLRTNQVLLCRYNVDGRLTNATLVNSNSTTRVTAQRLLARVQRQDVIPNNVRWACVANVGPSWTVHFRNGRSERLAVAVNGAGCAFVNPYRTRGLPVGAQQLPVRFASRAFVKALRHATSG